MLVISFEYQVQNEEETCVKNEIAKKNVTPESLNLDCVRLTDKKDVTPPVKYENKEKESFPLDLFYNDEYKQASFSFIFAYSYIS